MDYYYFNRNSIIFNNCYVFDSNCGKLAKQVLIT